MLVPQKENGGLVSAIIFREPSAAVSIGRTVIWTARRMVSGGSPAIASNPPRIPARMMFCPTFG